VTDSNSTPKSWWVGASPLGFTLLAASEVSKNAMLPEVAEYLYQNEERIVREQSETYSTDGDGE
jgi:hypothetical protein